MSKNKQGIIDSMSHIDFAIYKAQRNQRPTWQKLSHDEWVEFCNKMSEWFSKDAADEWDNYVIANKARKAKSDEEAVIKKALAKHNKQK